MAKQKKAGAKPLYVIKLDSTQWYNDKVRWAGVPLDQATRMTHKEACRLRDDLAHPKIFPSAVLEPVNS